MDTIVSNDAINYFKENNITSNNLATFFTTLYKLKVGDHIFFEANIIGYRRNTNQNLKQYCKADCLWQY